MQTFEATVEIDAKPGGKKFQGVWLVTKDGQRQVISYRPHGWWRAFEGRRVEATGEPYAPRGQAIAAQHFRVDKLRIVTPTPEDSLVSVSGELELHGAFKTHTWPAGTKLEGETMTVFAADDGTRYWLHHLPSPAPPLDSRVTVRAHQVEPSPFAARAGGRYLWVAAATPDG